MAIKTFLLSFLILLGLFTFCWSTEQRLKHRKSGQQDAADTIAERTLRGIICHPAIRKVRQQDVKRHCEPYNRTRSRGVCRKYLGTDVLFGNNLYQEKAESNVMMLTKILSSIVTILRVRIPGRCRRALIESACRQEMPLCDTSKRRPRPLKLCQSSCEFVVQQKCGSVLKRIESLQKTKQQDLFIRKFLVYVRSRCQQLPSHYETSFLSCYSNFNRERHNMKTTSAKCYEQGSINYVGPISRTVSRQKCQPWRAQCPHRHPFSKERYPELANAGNACRDPGGIRGRPWCFTSDGRKRWQYCAVPKCTGEVSTREKPSRKRRRKPKTTKRPTSSVCKGSCSKTTSCTNGNDIDCGRKAPKAASPDDCSLPRGCKNSTQNGSSMSSQSNIDESDVEIKEWVIYVLMATGAFVALFITAVIIIRLSWHKKKRPLEESDTTSSSWSSPYDCVPVINEKSQSASRQTSCTSAGEHCITEVGLRSIDPAQAVKV